jgi:hypothetical protein
MLSCTAPNFLDMSSAVFKLVPANSINVVGSDTKSSVSFDAIQINRGESKSFFPIQLALTKCHRRTESAVAHPTHEPVPPWLPIFHHDSRRSFDAGIDARAPRIPAASA